MEVWLKGELMSWLVLTCDVQSHSDHMTKPVISKFNFNDSNNKRQQQLEQQLPQPWYVIFLFYFILFAVLIIIITRYLYENHNGNRRNCTDINKEQKSGWGMGDNSGREGRWT